MSQKPLFKLSITLWIVLSLFVANIAPLFAFGVAQASEEEDGLTSIMPAESATSDPVEEAEVSASQVDTPNVSTQATIQVNVKTDQWDPFGSKQPSDASNCSLREALQAIFAYNSRQGCGNPPASVDLYVIDMAPGTYVLSIKDQLPNINRMIRINGKNKSVTIDGGGKGQFGGGDERDQSIFLVKSSGHLILRDIVLTNGFSNAGGAIRNEATVEIRDSLFKDNNSAMDGGAIYSTGQITIEKTIFQENNANGEGGAIWSGGGDLSILKSTFVKNTAWKGGGAIRCGAGGERLCNLQESDFIENQVTYLLADDSSYDILSDDAIGGAIKNMGRFQGSKLSFEKNFTQYSKGGGAFGNGSHEDFVYLTDSAFEDNHADPKPPYAPNAFGGAIYNEGNLHLIRDSIHDNKATVAGGVFNRGSILTMANVTISNNQANYQGGFGNGSPLHQNSEFGEAHLFHVTHTNNKDQVESKSPIFSLKSYYVYLSNSIFDGGCLGGIVYTYGGNLLGGTCATQEEPNVPAFGDVTSATGDFGVQGLTYNGGPELAAGFYSQKLDGSSKGIDAGRDGIFGCLQEDVNKRDQRDYERDNQQGKCDSGAYEQGTKEAKLKAELLPGENRDTMFGGGSGGAQATIYFRVYTDLGMSMQEQQLDLKNEGGGSIQYEASLEDNDSGRFVLQGKTTGAILGGQHETLSISCVTAQKGVRYGMLLLKTDLKDQKEIRYKLSCIITEKNQASASANQQPGSLSSGANTPGSPAKSEFEVSASSSQPTTVNATTTDSGNGVVSVSAAKQGVAAAEANGPITLNPGEKALVTVTCTPPGPGLFFGAVQVTTNDPDRPTMQYNVSCEGALPPTAEKLSPAGFYQGAPAVSYWGIGLSPDGKQLLAGPVGDNKLQTFSRNLSDGSLTLGPTFASPGMGGILDIAYTQDGKFVYYTSNQGDGVVALQRASDGTLSQTQVITKSTSWLCGINPIKICKVGTMDGAFALDLSPDEKQLYVVSALDSALTVLARDPVSGTLFFSQHFTRTIDGENVLGGAGDVLVSPDGKNVYVSTRTEDKVVVFTRDQSTGKLFYLRSYKDGVGGLNYLKYPGNMAISGDGQFLYVPSYLDDAITVFRRAPGDGALEFVEVVPNANGVFAVDLSHDAANLRLVASLYDGSAIRVYQRDATTGKLIYLDEYLHSNGSPLDTPVRLISSADDKHVYTTLQVSDGVRLLQSQHANADLFSFSPASVTAGSSDFTLGVNGSHFYPDSLVLWNGAALPTSYDSEHHLRATVDAAKVAAAGNVTIKVRNAAPGGGDSNGLSFAITPANQPGIPSIDSITPPAITAGSGDLAILIKGSNFTAQTKVQLNNKQVSTTYVNNTTLMALLLADDLQVDGPLGITVVNSTVVNASDADENDASLQVDVASVDDANATVKSKPMRFEAAGSGQVVQPSISGLSPKSAKVGDASLWVTISGYNFSNALDATSQAYWNGEARTTLLVNTKTLMMAVSQEDLKKAGKVTITVATPGVEKSNTATFTILNANDNPTPTASSYSAALSGTQWKVTIEGDHFVNGAKVRLNGSDRTTTFISPYQVEVILSNTDGKNGGALRVVNPAPGGGSSNDLVMTSLGTIRVVYVPLLTNGKPVLEAAASEPSETAATVDTSAPTLNSCAESSCVEATPTAQQPAATPEQNAGNLEQQPATGQEEERVQSVYLPVVSR